MSGTMLHSFPTPQDEDGLRLLALSRIPRCATCPRLSTLQAYHRSGSTGLVPAPPRTCTTHHCAPLVKRYGGSGVELLSEASSAFESADERTGCGQ